MIDILPLVRGWTWRYETRIATALLNQEILIFQPPTPSKEIGWLTGIDFAGNDSYLGLRIVMPGADSGYNTFAGLMAMGIVLPPPAGSYVGRFWQPNPLRTIGHYDMFLLAPAYALPFYGPVRVYMSLRLGTTEPYATGLIKIVTVIIEDRNLFLKDLRKVYYGRLAPLMDLLDHIPIMRVFTRRFEELGIRFDEKEIVEPPGMAR